MRPGPWAVVRDARCLKRDALATLSAKPDLLVALPAMVASSGEARLTGAFETNRDQGKRIQPDMPLAMKKAAINVAIFS